MRLIKYFTILFLLFCVYTVGSGQCDIPGGSFEQYDEVSDSLEAITGVTIDEPVYISHDFIPITRPAFLLFLGLLGELIGQELIDFSTNLFGQQRFSPGANGTEFGLQLSPDKFLNVADAVHLPFACSELHISLKGSYLHIGSENDSAIVVVVLGSDSLLAALGADHLPNLTDPYVDGVGIAILQGGDQEYSTFEIPIEYKEDVLSTDSAMIYFFAVGDEDFLAAGNQVHYVFDEFSFAGFIDATDERAQLAEKVAIYPNPVTDNLHIENDLSMPIDVVVIRDITGRVIKQKDIGHEANFQLDVHDLIQGYYITELVTSRGIISKTLIKQ